MLQVEYIPSYCGYAASKAAYDPVPGRPVLLGRNHNNPQNLYQQLHRAAAKEVQDASALSRCQPRRTPQLATAAVDYPLTPNPGPDPTSDALARFRLLLAD